MKRFLCLCIPAVLASCENPNDAGLTQHASVFWMEWPAQVNAGQRYEVRVVIPPLCTRSRLVVRQVSSTDTVAFQARWENIRPREWGCEPAGPIYGFTIVDAEPISGPARSIEVKATGREANSLRTFGRLHVVEGESSGQTLAAGRARFWSESATCHRIQPAGTPSGFAPSPDGYQLEGTPPDTSESAAFWVEGALTTGTTACQRWEGDTLIFRLAADSRIN